MKDLGDKGTLSVYYDKDADKVLVDAKLPASNFVGLSLGKSKKDTEMVMFNAGGQTDPKA